MTFQHHLPNCGCTIDGDPEAMASIDGASAGVRGEQELSPPPPSPPMRPCPTSPSPNTSPSDTTTAAGPTASLLHKGSNAALHKRLLLMSRTPHPFVLLGWEEQRFAKPTGELGSPFQALPHPTQQHNGIAAGEGRGCSKCGCFNS